MTVKVCIYHPRQRRPFTKIETWDTVVSGLPILPPGYTLRIRPGDGNVGAYVVIDYRRTLATRLGGLTFPDRPLIPPTMPAVFA